MNWTLLFLIAWIAILTMGAGRVGRILIIGSAVAAALLISAVKAALLLVAMF